MSWLDRLIEELNEIKEEDYFKFDSEVSAEDVVLGNATPRMLQLYTLWHRSQEEMGRALLNVESERNPKKRRKMINEILPLDAECEALQALFWGEAKNEFPPPGNGSLGITKGNQVVYLGGIDRLMKP